MFRGAGGWRGAVEWSALWMWVWVLIACVAIGAFLSVALLGVGRRRLAVVSLTPLALAGIFALLSLTGGSRNRAWMGSYLSSELAQETIAPIVIAMTLAFAIPSLWLGAWTGRPLARLAARVLLPPRLRPPLSVLWTADGLDPPRA
jgi:hypothetical protein